MPGEISRSNPGPRGGVPLVPSWVCDMKPDHIEAQGGICAYCRMPKERWKKPTVPQEGR